MRVLLVGSGGREHALAWALAASPLVTRLWCAPGNPGIAAEAELVPIKVDDLDGLVAFARAEAVDLVVVGPELPLTLGLVDRLEAAGVPAFGPSAAAARIEGSKGFMKDLAARAGVPTAGYVRARDLATAEAAIRRFGAPVVVKADGLAAGKGVTVAATVAEALAAAQAALTDGRFGAAGAELVIEQFLEGEEASFFALCDGEHALPLASAQDHKRAFAGDQGPNTGGMGAYSPAPCVTPEIAERTMAEIVRPTLAALATMGCPFKGVLYAGLMLTADGPKLIEFNARFGDPEAQVLLMRLKSDLLPALIAAREGQLRHLDLRWDPRPAIAVVLAAKGYPDAPTLGGEIRGLERAAAAPDVRVFHAGTTLDGEMRLRAAGGRVLAVTALGADLAAARDRAHAAIAEIVWDDAFWRRDIGWRALSRPEG